jgi:hypothetical protein
MAAKPVVASANVTVKNQHNTPRCRAANFNTTKAKKGRWHCVKIKPRATRKEKQNWLRHEDEKNFNSRRNARIG